MLSAVRHTARVCGSSAVSASATAVRHIALASTAHTAKRTQQHNKHLVAVLRSIHSAPSLSAEATAQLTQKAAQIRGADNSKQADTGIGARPLIPKIVPGTVDVTIDGRSSSVKGGEAPPAAAAAKHPAVHGDISNPSLKRDVPDDWTLLHPIWKDSYVGRVAYTHLPPQNTVDKLALWTIQAIRFNFDWMSGYSFGALTEKKAITRIVFLETVAGVPGSVAGTLRHLASLRRMRRDGGWINSLLAEAENERMHLLTALTIRQPGWFMKSMVFLSQGLFFNFFWISYLISPRFCHRLVGYLEEEAVVTYTKILHAIDHGELKSWSTTPAPLIARKYWSLPEQATFKHVIEMIRADEAHHRDVNHTLGSLKESDLNPFRDGSA